MTPPSAGGRRARTGRRPSRSSGGRGGGDRGSGRGGADAVGGCADVGGPSRPLATPADELYEQRAKLASIGRLPNRQQRLVWLQGLGFSYGEMADREGASARTVERQLLRAKKALREAA